MNAKLLIIIIPLLMLTGCGNDENPQPAPPENDNPPPAPKDFDTPPPGAEEKDIPPPPPKIPKSPRSIQPKPKILK